MNAVATETSEAMKEGVSEAREKADLLVPNVEKQEKIPQEKTKDKTSDEQGESK